LGDEEHIIYEGSDDNLTCDGTEMCKTWGDEEHCRSGAILKGKLHNLKTLKNFKKRRRKSMYKSNIGYSREELFNRMEKNNDKKLTLTEHEEEEEQVGAKLLEKRTSIFDEGDYRCDRSAIDHHPAVDGLCLAAEDVNLITSQIRKQKHAVECTPDSYDGKICLISERNQNCQKFQDGSNYDAIGFNKLIVRKDNFSGEFVQNDFENEGSRERSLYINDCECDRSAIDHHPCIGGSRLAAEGSDLCTRQVRRHKRVTECTPVHMME
jgi:hypothetical protein